MSIRDELLAIQARDKEAILHPQRVVDWAAKHPDSALHAALEWDDEKAAVAHRLWQVRRLVQLHVVQDDGAPQLVSLTFDRAAGGGYRSVSDVVKVPDLREIMLRDALEELQRVQRKYERVEELANVWNELEATKARAGKRGARVSRTAAA